MSCKSILIVEDEPNVRETLKDILELEGFCVATAENGQDALGRLQSYEHPCLILLDLMMPVMNGWQFLEALEAKHQHVLATIPVVVVSAVADLTDVQQKYQCQVMKKPVNMQTLIALAKEYCQFV